MPPDTVPYSSLTFVKRDNPLALIESAPCHVVGLVALSGCTKYLEGGMALRAVEGVELLTKTGSSRGH